MIYAYVPSSNTCVLDETPKDLSEESIEPLDDDAVAAIAALHWQTIQSALA